MILKGKKLLMFEDNIANITVQKAYLEKEGAQVRLFLGGTVDGIIERLPIDLIIMDLMLPGGKDGFDFFQIIRNTPELASIPIIAVSAMDASLAVSKSKALGFNGFIAKPVDVEQFPNQVASVIAGNTVWDANRR